MSKEFKIPQYTPLQLNSNIAYGLTKENNISKDELDSVQWLCEAYEHQIKQLADLEAKLAEKEKELARVVEFAPTIENNVELIKHIIVLDKDGVDFIKKFNQDKISFALEQLSQFKSELVNKVSPVNLSYTEYVQEVFKKIDNQIKQLKEHK